MVDYCRCPIRSFYRLTKKNNHSSRLKYKTRISKSKQINDYSYSMWPLITKNQPSMSKNTLLNIDEQAFSNEIHCFPERHMSSYDTVLIQNQRNIKSWNKIGLNDNFFCFIAMVSHHKMKVISVVPVSYFHSSVRYELEIFFFMRYWTLIGRQAYICNAHKC